MPKALRLTTLPLHPFLFAALPVLASLAQVKNLVLPEEIIPAIMAIEIAAIVVFAVAAALLRDWRRGAVVCSLCLGLFFTYRLIVFALDEASKAIIGSPLDERAGLLIYCILCLLCLLASIKTNWDFGKETFQMDYSALTESLNLMSVLLVALNAIPLISFEMKDEANSQHFVTKFKTAFDQVKLNSSAAKPDVYYIIVDGFANKLTMQDMYGCKTAPLYPFLEQHGFYVVPKARSNYDRTEFSVSSSMNMQYINEIPESLGKSFDGLNLFCRMIQDSATLRTFKRLGYKFVNVSSGTSATDWIYSADTNIRGCPLNQFSTAVCLLTPLHVSEKYVPFIRDLLADMRLCPGRYIDEVVSLAGPKFVLIHTDIAHAPCIFDEQGKKLPLPEGQYMINWGRPNQLAAQWKFSQAVLIDWLTRILEKTNNKAVIIIQSDHGSGIPEPKSVDWYNERMRILNAYYLPGKSNEGLYPTITPVNSFRLFFNDYFDAHLPMLPDNSWCAPNYAVPFDWITVQDKLSFP